MDTPINEHVWREMLNGRQKAREKRLATLASLPISTMSTILENCGLTVTHGESTVQVIQRIVAHEYPDLVHGESTPVAREMHGSIDVQGDVQAGFDLVPRAGLDEFRHMQGEPVVKAIYRDGDGYVQLDASYTREVDGSFTVLVSVAHLFREDYFKEFVSQVYAAAVTGEPENVVDIVNELRREQGWDSAELHPDMTPDAMLDGVEAERLRGVPNLHTANQVADNRQGEVEAQLGDPYAATQTNLPTYGSPEFEAEVQQRQDERSGYNNS